MPYRMGTEADERELGKGRAVAELGEGLAGIAGSLALGKRASKAKQKAAKQRLGREAIEAEASPYSPGAQRARHLFGGN